MSNFGFLRGFLGAPSEAYCTCYAKEGATPKSPKNTKLLDVEPAAFDSLASLHQRLVIAGQEMGLDLTDGI